MSRSLSCVRVAAALAAVVLVSAGCNATSGSGTADTSGPTVGQQTAAPLSPGPSQSVPSQSAPSQPVRTETVTETGPGPAPSSLMGGGPSRTAVAPRQVTRTVTATGRAPAASSNDALREAYNHSTAATPGYFEADDGTLSFTSPSQNIVCTIDGTGEDIDCAIIRYDFDQPDCNLGADFVIAPDGQPQQPVCLAVRTDPAAHQVLPYNYSLTSGSFACVSTTAGIACLDLDTDTGFAISRAAYARVT